MVVKSPNCFFLLTHFSSASEYTKKPVTASLLLCVAVYWPILFSQTLIAPLVASIVEDAIIYVSSLFLGSCVNAEGQKKKQDYLNKQG